MRVAMDIKKGNQDPRSRFGSTPTPKRLKMNAGMREECLRDIARGGHQLHSNCRLTKRGGFRRNQFKLCDEIMDEIGKLKTTLREKDREKKVAA